MKYSDIKLITIPDVRLYKKSIDVKEVNNEVRKLMDKMLELMYEERGIGLAAPQVGINENIFVVDLQENEFIPMFIANPVFIFKSKEKVLFKEGCLSVPNELCQVERSARVKLEYLDYNNKKQQIEADGLLAICLQHEYDHLLGITIKESGIKIEQ